jgi:hypothetical protein
MPVSVQPAEKVVADFPPREQSDILVAKPWVTPDRSHGKWWIGSGVTLFAIFGIMSVITLSLGKVFYHSIPRQALSAFPQPRSGAIIPVEPSRVEPRPQAQPVHPPEDTTMAMKPPPTRSADVATELSPAPRHGEAVTPPNQAPSSIRLGSAAHGENNQTLPRRELDRSPTASGRAKADLIEVQRGGLFNQAAGWRSHGLATPPVPPPFSEGRIVIHYRGSSSRGTDMANRVAAAAGPLAARVQTRAVAGTPSAPEIRFFHPEDEARARQLAGTLHGLEARWDIRSFSAFRPSPSVGTIEVWVPTR